MATVREHALHILRGPYIPRIRFEYTGLGGVRIRVGAQTFERVAVAIENNLILLDGPAGLPRGDDGCYTPDNFTDATGHRYSGRFNLRTHFGSRVWDLIFIHEAVHASFDLTGSRLAGADDEAAAYLASAMYAHLSGLPLHRWSREIGYELAVRATARRALRTATITSDSQIAALRLALISEGYGESDDPSNPFPLGTPTNPTFYRGDR